MKSNVKRWSQVERLFNQALDQPPEERQAFLERACSLDHDLRDEVQSLLDYHGRADDFIEIPAMDLEARKLAQEKLEDARDRQIGPYVLISLIGLGGMASVFRARDQRTGELVALKLLPFGLAADKYRLRRFNREAKALKRLSHKNIAQFYEAGESEGQNYIAMELVEGTPLEELISRGPLREDQVLTIAIQVVEALRSAHARAIIHRDIKPSNLILRPSGEIKMLDFGLAKALADSGVSSRLDLSLESLTRTGTVLGTVDYMSPEQIKGTEVDHRTDLFAVGVLLHQISTGQLPFHGRSYGDTIRRILDEPPAAFASTGSSQTLRKLEQIVFKCLEKSPDKRYGSADELLMDLKGAAGEPVRGDEGYSGTIRKGRGTVYWLLGAALLVVILTLAILLMA